MRFLYRDDSLSTKLYSVVIEVKWLAMNRMVRGGGYRIRTCEGREPSGFQDPCNWPLCEPTR